MATDRKPQYDLYASQAIPNLFRVMNQQIIKNQKYFFVSITNQPPHKIDKLFGIHILFVKHKTQFPAL